MPSNAGGTGCNGSAGMMGSPNVSGGLPCGDCNNSSYCIYTWEAAYSCYSGTYSAVGSGNATQGPYFIGVQCYQGSVAAYEASVRSPQNVWTYVGTSFIGYPCYYVYYTMVPASDIPSSNCSNGLGTCPLTGTGVPGVLGSLPTPTGACYNTCTPVSCSSASAALGSAYPTLTATIAGLNDCVGSPAPCNTLINGGQHVFYGNAASQCAPYGWGQEIDYSGLYPACYGITSPSYANWSICCESIDPTTGFPRWQCTVTWRTSGGLGGPALTGYYIGPTPIGVYDLTGGISVPCPPATSPPITMQVST